MQRALSRKTSRPIFSLTVPASWDILDSPRPRSAVELPACVRAYLEGNGMAESATQLNELNLLNLTYLALLQAAAQRDPAQAVYTFGIRYDDVLALRDLSVQALQTLALSADHCLCTLRITPQQIVDIVKSPPALAGALVTSRTPLPTQKLAA
jgi:hypothetical protein